MTSSKFILTTYYLTLILGVLFIVDVCIGSVNLFAVDTSSSLFTTILYDIRLPKALTCLIAGASLALCGLLMQSLFRNPLAGPYALGVSSGASLLVAIATMLLTGIHISQFYIFGKTMITIASMLGAFGITCILFIISKKSKSNIMVLLIGLMLAQILGALQSVVEFISSADSLKTFVVWGMGSVSNAAFSDLMFMFPVFIVAILGAYYLIKPLNAILLNEQYAQNLGINTSLLRFQVIIITAVLVGLITAFCGPIAFVGISVPIASRLFFKTAHHLHQITFCLLLGASVLLFADVVCQSLSNQLMLPINIVTTLIGSPVVMYLLFKSKLQIG